ncbi:unnamed protein product [Moneuplotes crassus]|uniref:Uncharacterized protein n=1 Tax=Euplotes crassus TaxID=5936 RepID=A0AAD2D9R0_EUPCR|nr:unnamed protein product [Moneuplotes crassus]
MECQSQRMNKDNIEALKKEETVLRKENEVDKIFGTNYYFNNFSEELEHKDIDYSTTEDILPQDMRIDFMSQETLAFAKKLNFFGSFIFEHFDLFSMKTKNKIIANYIKRSFPEKMTTLTVYSGSDLLPITSHVFNIIMRINSRVLKKIIIRNYKISIHQFKRIMASYKNVYETQFGGCKISVPTVFDLSQSMRNTKINHLEFVFCGNPELSDWKDNPQKFITLIQCLATSPDFKLSIKTIRVVYCGIESKKCRQILDENGFNDVKL